MESEKPKKTCEERIDEEMRSRFEQLIPDVRSWSRAKCERHLKAENQEITTTDLRELRSAVLGLIREQADGQLLSYEKIITYKLCLSWGGPADYFELEWSEYESGWTGGRYILQDWFDGANRPIGKQEAEQLAEFFGIYPEN